MDLLWKKVSDSPDAPYVDIFKNVARNYPEEYEVITTKSVDGFPTPPKSDSVSIDLRQQGNVQFKSGFWLHAMACYNDSLCFAEIGGENVGLAYSNRSACFLHMKMFKKCIVDIDLAIEAKCPERLLQKLESRRADCLKAMAQEIKERTLQLDFDEDKNFPSLAGVLQIKSNKQFGRHYIAKANIDIGKVVLVEEPFVSTPVRRMHDITCDGCFKFATNLIACKECTNTSFCSQKCMDDNEFHATFCGQNYELCDNYRVEYVARSILYAIKCFSNIDGLMKFMENLVAQKSKGAPIPTSTADMLSKYRAFLQLNLCLTDDDEYDFFIHAYEVYDYLMMLPAVQEKFSTRNQKRFLMHLTIMHYCLVRCNSFENHVGGGIYLLLNNINHSCAPNALIYRQCNKYICIITRPLKKGDQLFITYGEQYRLNGKAERQESLLKDFDFRCNCEKCDNDDKALDGGWSAQIDDDPDYQYLKKSFYQQIDYKDAQKCAIFKKKCFKVLTKYANEPWCKQIDLILMHLNKLVNEFEFAAMH